jgi:hypothetical protein
VTGNRKGGVLGSLFRALAKAKVKASRVASRHDDLSTRKPCTGVLEVRRGRIQEIGDRQRA